MANIAFQVDERERADLVRRADGEKINLSDYIRVRLGLRALGTQAEESGDDATPLQRRIDDHEQRLRALEARG
jgi:hypothetical protein